MWAVTPGRRSGTAAESEWIRCGGPEGPPTGTWALAPRPGGTAPGRDVGRRPTGKKGTPRAPARARLSLLPSGPGEVHRVTPHEGSGTTVEESLRAAATPPP